MGLDPDKFWRYSLRDSGLLLSAFFHKQVLEWERTRNIEFSMYSTQFNPMNGKQVFKNIKQPQNLYKLPTDKKQEPIKRDRKREERAINNMKQWLKT